MIPVEQFRENIIEHFENDKYESLSNFALVPIEFRGVIYASVEHAFQSAKCDDPEWKAKCVDPDIKPGRIKSLANHVKMIEGWHHQKLIVMKECVRKKYRQEPYRQLLIDTEDKEIIEGNHWFDSFWGIRCDTGEGKNHLGKIIMEIRDELNFEVHW